MLKIAVIVNDMGEINLDTDEIRLNHQERRKWWDAQRLSVARCVGLKAMKALREDVDYLVAEQIIREPLPVARHS